MTDRKQVWVMHARPGDPATAVDWGHALRFDNGRVDMGDVLDIGSSDQVTYAFIINNHLQGASGLIIGKRTGTGSGTQVGWQVLFDSAGNIFLRAHNGTNFSNAGWNASSVNAVLGLGPTRIIAEFVPGGVMRLWTVDTDGTRTLRINSTLAAGDYSNSVVHRFGLSGADTLPLRADLREVGRWDRLLTEEEMGETGGVPLSEVPVAMRPDHYWSMNEGAGGKVADVEGGFDGARAGTVLPEWVEVGIELDLVDVVRASSGLNLDSASIFGSGHVPGTLSSPFGLSLSLISGNAPQTSALFTLGNVAILNPGGVDDGLLDLSWRGREVRIYRGYEDADWSDPDDDNPERKWSGRARSVTATRDALVVELEDATEDFDRPLQRNVYENSPLDPWLVFDAQESEIRLPLDRLLGGLPAAAWSLRKVRDDYAGSSIRVRRSNDDAEADIGFTVEGDLNEVALAAHVGANSGFVAKLYDQISGAHFEQGDPSLQPRIVNAGTIDRADGGSSRPAMRFLTTAARLEMVAGGLGLIRAASRVESYLVIHTDTGSPGGSSDGPVLFIDRPTAGRSRYSYHENRNGNDQSVLYHPTDSVPHVGAFTSGAPFDPDLRQVTAIVHYTGKHAELRKNGIEAQVGGSFPSDDPVADTNSEFIWLGGHPLAEVVPAQRRWLGRVCELVVFDRGVSTDDRDLLESDQASYWKQELSMEQPGDQVAFGNVLNRGLDSFSIAVRFRTSTLQTATIVGKGRAVGAGSGQKGYSIGTGVGGAVLAEIADNRGNIATVNHSPAGGYHDGEWHTLAMRVNRSTDRLQLIYDGEQVADVAALAVENIDNTDPLFWGRSPSGTTRFTGDLERVIMWDHPASDVDISDALELHTKVGEFAVPFGIDGLWPIVGNVGHLVGDLSDGGNDGVIGGSVWWSGFRSGIGDIEGKPIPIVVGVVFNREPVLLDPVKLVYQAHDGAGAGAVTTFSGLDEITQRELGVTEGGLFIPEDTETTGDFWRVAPQAGTVRYDAAAGLFRLGSIPTLGVRVSLRGTLGAITDLQGSQATPAACFARTFEIGIPESGIVTDEGGPPNTIEYVLGIATWASLFGGLTAGEMFRREGVTVRQALDAFAVAGRAQWTVAERFVQDDVRLRCWMRDRPGGGHDEFRWNETISLGSDDAVAGLTVDGLRLTGSYEPARSLRLSFARFDPQPFASLAAALPLPQRISLSEEWRIAERVHDALVLGRHLGAEDREIQLALASRRHVVEDFDELGRRLALHDVLWEIWEADVTDLAFELWPGDQVTISGNRFGMDAGRRFWVLGIDDSTARAHTTLTLFGPREAAE